MAMESKEFMENKHNRLKNIQKMQNFHPIKNKPTKLLPAAGQLVKQFLVERLVLILGTHGQENVPADKLVHHFAVGRQATELHLFVFHLHLNESIESNVSAAKYSQKTINIINQLISRNKIKIICHKHLI